MLTGHIKLTDMKKLVFFLAFSFFAAIPAHSQKVAIKNNLIFDATASPNIGVEFRLAKRSSIELWGSWNPFVFKEHKQFRHYLIQPEYRYWTCEAFNGLFFGAHAFAGEFNIGRVKLPFGALPVLHDRRFEGSVFGGGVSVGYQWVISPLINIEVSAGAGLAYINYEQYHGEKCGDFIDSKRLQFLGPTKASVSLVFLIR